MFDRIALSYDRINRILSLGQDLRWRKTLAYFLPAKPHLELLDLATGTGDQVLAALKMHPSIARVVGVDLSSQMLEQARRKLSSNSKVHFLTADATHLPFSNESFDAVSCSFGIRNMPDSMKALKEMHRVLRPGGTALILEFAVPRFPIRPFVLFYLRHILPKVGGYLSADHSAYTYLNQTIESYPSGTAFLNWMKEAGFKTASWKKLSFGAVGLYIGIK